MLKNISFVALGGATGAVLRYLTVLAAVRAFPGSRLPLGTFTVNMLGCFLIGLAYAVLERTAGAHSLRLLVITGMLGGFTTFSAFGHETMYLIRTGSTGAGLGYALLSLGLGLGAVWLGTVCLPQS